MNKSLEGLVLVTVRHNPHYTEGHINVIGTKVAIHFDIPTGDLRLYISNLSKLNLTTCTVPRPRRQQR